MIDKNTFDCVGYIGFTFMQLYLKEKQFIPEKTVSGSLHLAFILCSNHTLKLYKV